MIIRIEDLKVICSTILNAVDSNEISKITETLELEVKDKILYLNVTNREYYAQVKFNINENIDFHATVNANLFLKLIANTTSDTVELKVSDTDLEVRGNGKYKLPLIFEGEKLLVLPQININNITQQFNISSDILNSILKFNSKELNKGVIAKPVQRMYYLDEQGCITFTSGACVNNFNLDKPIKLLLNNRIVKLFKLFKSGDVNFTLGYDNISEEIIQTKVKFENNDICITAVLNNEDSLINSVPVKAIRDRALTIYSHSVVINRAALNDAINRMLLFTAGYGTKETLKPYSKFIFNSDSVDVYDINNINTENISYNNSDPSISEAYEALLDLTDIKTTLDNCSDEYINIRFGNHQAIVLARNNIYNIIPECHSV